MIRVRGIEIDHRARVVRHAGRERVFLKRKQGIWETFMALVCGGGLTTGQLVDLVYRDDVEGGPEEAFQRMRVFLTRTRKLCAGMGLEIRAFRAGPTGQHRYEIVPREVA